MPQNILLEFLGENYAIAPIVALKPLTGGEENQNFLVTTGEGQSVLRIYSTHHSTTGLRKLPEIEYEIDFMEAARDHGVPTPPVVRTKRGERVTTITIENQPHFATLFGYAQGEGAMEYKPETARAVAGTLMALRRASLAFRRPVPRPWPGDIVHLSLEFYAANRALLQASLDLLDRLNQSALDSYAQAMAANLPTGVIHGDVKLGNLLFESNQISAVIDFDDYRESCLLEEVARTVMHDLDSPTRNAIRAGCYPIFRDAFAADPTVTAAELAHLNTFLRARLLYDVTSYELAGLDGLVEDVLADPQVREVILTGL